MLGSGIARIGCSTMSAHLELGRDAHGFGYGGTAMKSHANTFEAYGQKFGDSQVVGCFMDLDDMTIGYSVDGVDQSKAFDIPKTLAGSVFFPAFALKDCRVEVNFGQIPFLYDPAARGFKGHRAGSEGVEVVSVHSSECFHQTSSGPRKVRNQHAHICILCYLFFNYIPYLSDCCMFCSLLQ